MRLRYLGLLTGLSLLAARSDLPGPNHQLTDDEAAFLAQEFAGAALDGVSQSMAGSPGMAGAPSAAPAAGPITWERTFTETRPCPAGGTVTTSGSSKGTIDSETHSGTVEVNHLLAMDECARTRGDVTITRHLPVDHQRRPLRFLRGQPDDHLGRRRQPHGDRHAVRAGDQPGGRRQAPLRLPGLRIGENAQRETGNVGQRGGARFPFPLSRLPSHTAASACSKSATMSW